ncbi:DUF975 family protein [Lentilactobacillus kosonis]|uniref:Integral membrane protein n=1 Tax=Lentilactobacillus kosonis TaxID=2810561 RepID=A0A401FNA9_9LACO|nr:DUF975 family protein [Lentilactobacillus kosonis]GAY73872.1 integral membrane protein [Lentilactobacillus kosonis]
MSKTSRVNIKEWSKKELNSNFKFYVVLIICALLAIILSRGISSWPDVHQIDIENTSLNFIYGWFGLSFAVSVIGAMFQTSAMFTMIDITRGEEKHTAPMQKTFAIFDKGQYFLGWIVISILVGIFTFLWSLLLIFPGIIKSYAYSQSVFIYRDAIKRGKPMGYLEAITESRKRMVGKKWFLFVF